MMENDVVYCNRCTYPFDFTPTEETVDYIVFVCDECEQWADEIYTKNPYHFHKKHRGMR